MGGTADWRLNVRRDIPPVKADTWKGRRVLLESRKVNANSSGLSLGSLSVNQRWEVKCDKIYCEEICFVEQAQCAGAISRSKIVIPIYTSAAILITVLSPLSSLFLLQFPFAALWILNSPTFFKIKQCITLATRHEILLHSFFKDPFQWLYSRVYRKHFMNETSSQSHGCAIPPWQ